MSVSLQTPSEERCDVAIVGAGPSGLAAAALLREHGVSVTIIDEQPRAGGQILRQPPRNFAVAHWLPAKLYDRVKAALGAVNERSDIDWRFQSTVLGLMQPSPYRLTASAASRNRATTSGLGGVGTDALGQDGAVARGASVSGHSEDVGKGSGGAGVAAHQLWIQGPTGCYVLRAAAVLLAPGCYERPLAFPGWTLPGVMGAGAIQGFVKSQQFVPGNRFVLAGSHPLQLVVADQLLSAGAQVAAVVFTQQISQAMTMVKHPIVALRQRRQLFETAKILSRLRRARVPVIFGHSIVRADGGAAVERATIAAIDPKGIIDHHRTQVFECDRVGICHGFLASSELARQAGAAVHWREQAGGWLAEHNDWLESSIKNLFLAGEITSVDGADAALEKGRIAAVGILRSLGRIDEAAASRLAAAPRERLAQLQDFAAVLQELAKPPAELALQTMSDDTILCRCESIKRGELQRQLTENKHVTSADAAKLLTRVGMGLCQGRMCGDNVAKVIAAARGLQPTEVGPFQAQAPVKPVPLATLTRGRCG